MAVKQGRVKRVFERTHLARHRRLRQMQRVAGVSQAPGVGHRVKYSKLIPIHVRNFPKVFPIYGKASKNENTVSIGKTTFW